MRRYIQLLSSVIQPTIMSTSRPSTTATHAGGVVVSKHRKLKLRSNYHSNKAEISLANHSVWWPDLAEEISRQQLSETMKAYLKNPVDKSVRSTLNPTLCPFCRVYFDKVCNYVQKEKFRARLSSRN